MKCITTVYFSVLINGKILGKIHPKCGLRQEDILFPYLFLFCIEGLSSILKKMTDEKRFHRIKATAQGLAISHLFFADYGIYFIKASAEECPVILDCLRTY